MGLQPQSMDTNYLDGWATGWLAWKEFITSTRDHGDIIIDEEPVLVLRGLLADRALHAEARSRMRPNLSSLEGSTPFESRPHLHLEAAAG